MSETMTAAVKNRTNTGVIMTATMNNGMQYTEVMCDMAAAIFWQEQHWNEFTEFWAKTITSAQKGKGRL